MVGNKLDETLSTMSYRLVYSVSRNIIVAVFRFSDEKMDCFKDIGSAFCFDGKKVFMKKAFGLLFIVMNG